MRIGHAVGYPVVAAGLCLTSAAAPALAQFSPAWTWNRRSVNVSTTGAVTTTRGWEFTVSQPIQVTAIGVYDDESNFGSAATALSFPGMAQQHEVALWDAANTSTPLATGVVAAGVATPLCQDGYRYVMITPTTLTPGHNYVVSAFWPGDTGVGNFDPYADTQSSGAPVTVDPRVTLVQARHFLFGGPGQFPSSITGSGTTSYIGLLNFRIGPGTWDPNPPANLTTTFRGGNGQAGNMFDLKALNPAGLTVTGWQINLGDEVTNATPIEVSIYWRTGTHVGNTSSAAGWTLLGMANVLSWGNNRPTPVPLGGLILPPNQTIGVFITTRFITSMPPPASPPFLNYSNIPPASAVFSSADLEISGGVGKANPLFTGATFASKMWNGGVLFTVGSVCYANCDGSTVAPALNVNDFTCFLNRFAAGDSYANCDASTVAPVLNVNDFTCFLNKYAAGCP